MNKLFIARKKESSRRRPSAFIRAGSYIFLLFFLVLSACSTAGPTPYQAGGDSRYGYREESLLEGAFQLAFAGNSYTDRETVERYFIYRAAERCGELGYARFSLKDKLVERLVQETYDPYWGPYWGYGYGWRGYGGSGVAISVPLGAGPGYRSVRYTASAIVIPFNGEPPLGVEGYKEVEQVLGALGPGIIRPAEDSQ